MAKFVMKFCKRGYICYTSHLDMIRLFKRTFKKSGIKLKYSQGFNPHPKMGFAQPLSLGYSSCCELVEFEVSGSESAENIKKLMKDALPDGIEVLDCKELPHEGKTLAALVNSASYMIKIPLKKIPNLSAELIAENFLAQESIIVKKKQKKKKELKDLDIKPMIKKLNISIVDDNIIMETKLDAGSISNLNPELLITAFLAFSGIETPREEIEVERISLNFVNKFQV